MTLSEQDGATYDLLSLPDLVQAKKTQRDKVWPMLRRLLEADYLASRDTATAQQLKFWLQELRTPELLRELAGREPAMTGRMTANRPLLAQAVAGDLTGLAESLEAEEKLERERDRRYWHPLRKELEYLRRQPR